MVVTETLSQASPAYFAAASCTPEAVGAPRVAIVVDHPDRDLPGLVLLARELCASGVECIFIPLNLWSTEIWRYAPDFVLLNYFRQHSESSYHELAEAGIGIGVLDTEGGVFENLQELNRDLVRDPRLRSTVRCYCCWGPKVANHLISEGLFDDRQVILTGTPRTDFYATPWRAATLQIGKVAEPFGKNLILFNSAFSLGNPGFLTREQQLEELVRDWQSPRDQIREFQAIEMKSLTMLAEAANQLAQRFRDATVVYRPHPFERLETYRGLLADLDNLHCLRAGGVAGWIGRAKAVVQHGSSTAIEAGMAGVPAFLPSWIPAWHAIPAADDAATRLDSPADLMEAVRCAIAGTSAPFGRPNIDQIIEEWFYRVDGLAYRRVADAILKDLSTAGRKERIRACQRRTFGLNANRVGSPGWLKANIRARLRLSPGWSFGRWKEKPQHRERTAAWDRSAKYFDCEQVRQISLAIAQSGVPSAGQPLEVSPAGSSFYRGGVTPRSIRLGRKYRST